MPPIENQIQDVPRGGAKAWLIWALAASSFGYAFFQRVAPSVMVQDLMREFAVGAAILGNLSALYLYAYAGLQVPIGMLIDRTGPRATISASLLIAALGSTIFASAETIAFAYLGRLLIGIGCSVGFVGTLLLISRWFAPHRYAFMSGLTMLVAMASAVGSQAPLAFAVERFGWRATLFAGAGLALVLSVAIGLIVRNDPRAADARQRPSAPRSSRAFRSLFANGQIWIAGAVAALLSAPMLAFGGLWGVPYLMLRYHIERPEAALFSSFIFFGWAIGAPAGGFIADRITRRKLPLVVAAGLLTACLAALFYLPLLPLVLAGGLIFLAGVAGGVMVNVYAYGREITPREMDGSVTGFLNTFSVGSGALFQPLIGLLLDLQAGSAGDGTPQYLLQHYTIALSSLVAGGLAAILFTTLMRETFCRRCDETRSL